MKKIMVTSLLAFSSITSLTWAGGIDKNNHTGWYVGGQIGRMGVSRDVDDSYAEEYNDQLMLIGSYGGYNFTNWFGLEVSSNFSSSKDKLGSINIENSYFIFSFQPKMTYQVTDQIGLYGKAGVSFVSSNIKSDEHINIGGYTYELNENMNGLGFSVGAGIQLALTRGINLRFSYDYTSSALENNDDDYMDVDFTANQVSFGVHYQF